MIGAFKLRSFRPPDQQPNRLACNWLLISAASAIGFHVAHLPLWLTAFAALILLWRFLIENLAWRIPGRAVRWLLLLLTALVVFRHYGTLLGRDAGVAYLVVLVALKILEVRTLRDYLLVVFLIYVVVLGALLFSQSLPTGAYAMLVVLVTTHALIRLNNPHPLRQADTARVLATLMLQSLPLLLILYFLFPRIQGTLWSLPVDAHSGRTGMSDRLSAGSINRLYEDDTIAFRAEFEGRPPDADQLYWRIYVLSDTDGRQWLRNTVSADGGSALDYRASDPPTRYSVLLQPHDQHWVPTLELAAAAAPATRVDSGYVLRSNRRVRSLQRYELSSHFSYATPRLSRFQARHNTHWPVVPSRRVLDLVRTWRARADDPAELAAMAVALFRQAPFRYTLSPPLLAGDTLDQFLFETRAGYCEHYASAFAALMRLSGVPARLVVGYQGGQWNEAGQYMIVRQSDAHAWAEVWLPPRGWVRIDPTAAIAPERIELGSDALRRLDALGNPIGGLSVEQARLRIAPGFLRGALNRLSLRWDSINNSWNKWVMAYGPRAQRELLRLVGIRTPNWVNIVAAMTLAILVLMSAMAGIWMARSRQKTDPVVRLYGVFCSKLGRVGLARAPSEGPADFAARVARARDDLSAPVSRITGAYIALRYGRTDPAATAVLRRQVRAFRPG